MNIDVTGALAHTVTTIRTAVDGSDKHVSSDATKLKLPGVLVQFTGLDLDTLEGYTVQGRVLVISGDHDDAKVLRAWEDLLGQVLDADLEVTGVIVPVPVDMPQHDQPLPALAIPINLHQE